eukprot:2784304-Prymnesium_polylepis.2
MSHAPIPGQLINRTYVRTRCRCKGSRRAILTTTATRADLCLGPWSAQAKPGACMATAVRAVIHASNADAQRTAQLLPVLSALFAAWLFLCSRRRRSGGRSTGVSARHLAGVQGWGRAATWESAAA